MAADITPVSDRSWLRDAAERVLVTAVEAFLAALVGAHALDMPALQQAWNAAAVAGIAAALSLVKSIAARYTGNNPESASLVD